MNVKLDVDHVKMIWTFKIKNEKINYEGNKFIFNEIPSRIHIIYIYNHFSI